MEQFRIDALRKAIGMTVVTFEYINTIHSMLSGMKVPFHPMYQAYRELYLEMCKEDPNNEIIEEKLFLIGFTKEK
jgi:hypothetical protein